MTEKLILIEKIVTEELETVKKIIIARIAQELAAPPVNQTPTKPLPANPNYSAALAIYKNGINHSLVARSLGVSVNAAKKYYTWLVIYGYLPKEKTSLSDAEVKAVDCIYAQKLSLRETAAKLGWSVTSVVMRRDSALRKGYDPKSESTELHEIFNRETGL